MKLKCHNRFSKFQNLCVRICFLFQGRGEEGFDRSFDVRRKRFARRKTFRGRQVPWNHLEPCSRFVSLPLILLVNTGPDKPLCRLGKVHKSYEKKGAYEVQKWRQRGCKSLNEVKSGLRTLIDWLIERDNWGRGSLKLSKIAWCR